VSWPTSRDDTASNPFPEKVHHRLADSCGVQVEDRALPCLHPDPVRDLGDPLGDPGIAGPERQALQVADDEVRLSPTLDLPQLGFRDADRGRVALLSDVDSNRDHGALSSSSSAVSGAQSP
jgi:hypothetical protein